MVPLKEFERSTQLFVENLTGSSLRSKLSQKSAYSISTTNNNKDGIANSFFIKYWQQSLN